MTPPHIILHPGFHKTGTSSTQAYLSKWQSKIPNLGVYISKDFKPLNDRAWIYGVRPYLPQRLRVRSALPAALRQMPHHDTIVISCENLTGVPPGFIRTSKTRVTSYAEAGTPLLRDMIAALRQRFEGCKITLTFSLRGRDAWLASNYAQQLSSRRLTEEFDAFSDRFDPAFTLEQEAQRLIDALTPDAAQTHRLEDSATSAQGPATPILRLIGLTEAEISALPKATRRNRRRSPELQAALLNANRTIKGRRALAAARRSILAR